MLADEVVFARTTWARLRGLLGRDGLAAGEALVIEPCTSIHTFFMRFSIDVLFLDGDGRVLRAISSLRPWRVTRIYPAARTAVELPTGTLARAAVREGDRVEFDRR